MRIWVDIESPYDTKLGKGPLANVTNWRSVKRLDRAGNFSFETPVSDQRTDLIAVKRFARCYGLLNDEMTELGAGIIDEIETVIDARGAPVYRVSGSDLFQELTYRSVADLDIWTYAEETPKKVFYHDVSAGTNTDMTQAYDDDPGTSYALALPSDDYIYIRADVRITGAKFDITGANTVTATMAGQYYNERGGWESVSGFTDGTLSGGCTLAQDGSMTWDHPRNAVPTTHGDEFGYWVRLSPSATLDSVDFVEIDVRVDKPSSTAYADILDSYAPSGWSRDTTNGYAATESTAYMSFSGESVLEALIKLAEHTGEHFRLGSGRKVVWIQDDPKANPTKSGYRAIAGADPVAVEDNPRVCLIRNLRRIRNSYDLITRIRPYGAGLGTARISLADIRRTTAAVGYTLSISGSVATSNYLKSNAATTSYGIIEIEKSWPEVGRQEASGYDLAASEQLYQRAYEYLSRHDTPEVSFRGTVMKLDGMVEPGETIKVIFRHYVDSYKAIDISDDYIILETTTEITGAGIRTIEMQWASTDAWPDADIYRLAADIGNVQRGFG